MSTIDRTAATLPPLVEGQRLDRATFHERYEAMPPGIRAELIGGVVYMPSPLSFDHGRVNVPVVHWLADYEAETPGVQAAINATVLLDDSAEVQPDVLLHIDPASGGRTRIEGKYLAGPPELVVEVSASSRAIDLGPKLLQYERSGVGEYLVVALEPEEVLWFARRDGRFERRHAGADGLLRSEVFPGLWLDPDALLRRDLRRLRGALALGIASPEHAAFVERLASKAE